MKEKKTNVIKFNFKRNYDFPPELLIDGFHDQLKIITETKLLGGILTSGFKMGS